MLSSDTPITVALAALNAVHVLRERVRLDVAALRVRRRIEVDDDRAFLQRIGQRVVELFAGQRRFRGEHRSGVAFLQSSGEG